METRERRRSWVTREPLAASLLVGCLALVLTSLAHLPCLGEGGNQYRPFCHTELPALFDRQVNLGQMSQPPLVELVSWLGTFGGFWPAVALLVGCLALWIWATAGDRDSWRGMAVAASPVMVTVGLVDLTLLPVALCATALLLLERRRELAAGVALGFAMGAGPMPFAVAVALLAAEGLRRGWESVVVPASGALFVCLMLHLPFLAGNPAAVIDHYYGQITTPSGLGSPWALGQALGIEVKHGGTFGVALFVLFTGCFLGHLRATGRRPAAAPVVAAVTLAALGLGTTFPPQSGLWVLFACSLVRPRLLELGLVALSQVAHTTLAWFIEGQRAEGVTDIPWTYWPLLLLQLGVMLWIMLQAMGDAVSAPAAEPAPGDPGPVPVHARSGATSLTQPERWRPAWITSFTAVTITHVAFLLIGYMGQLLETGSKEKPSLSLDIWNRWDTTRFIEVMEKGYGPESGDNTAFFPAFPMAMRMLHAVGLEPVLAGVLISYVACLVACAYLYQLARSHGLDGEHAVIYLLLFPTAVFLTAAYTEALFLAGAIPAFYHARRSQPLVAAPFAALAVGTRTVGLVLLVGLAYEMVIRAWPKWRQLLKVALSLAVGIAPFVAYGLHLQRVRGSFFDFMRAQKDGWGREAHTFRESLETTLNTWNGDFPTNWLLAWRLEVVFALVMVGLLLWLFWKGHVGYALFCGLTMTANLTNTWYFSNPRIALSLFPFALLAASLVQGHPRRHTWLMVCSAMLAAGGAMVFTRGAWFY